MRNATVLLTASAALGSSAAGAETASAPPGPSGLIAFHADPGGNSGLYVTRPDGSGVRLVGPSLAGHPFGEWSPEGRRLAFLSGSYGEGDLMIVRVSGGSERRLGQHVVRSFDWSPDGTRLVYESTNEGIWTVPASGKGRPTRLTRSGSGPVWSPNGRWVAYFAGAGKRLDVFKVRAAGGPPIRLTSHRAPDHSPHWSPDGSRLAFVSERTGNSDLYVVRANGSDLRRLTRDRAPDEAFDWAPDGRRLVYVSYRGGADPLAIGRGNAEVYSVDIASRRVRNLSNNPDVWDGDPSWSPDGAWIVFTRRTDHGEIGIMRADGTDQRLLRGAVPAPFNDCCAAWQPRR